MKSLKRTMLSAMAIALSLLVMLFVVGCSGESVISAYDIAVKNGFVGTEQEWLESLKGEDGTSVTQFDIYEIFEQFQAENPSVDFEEFLKEYLSVNTSSVEVASTLAIRSTVSILCQFTKRGRNEKYYAAGSGVIYSLDKASGNGYVITNYHVVYDTDANTSNRISDNIGLYFYGREYSDFVVTAQFVGGSSTYDIAVLRFEGADLSKTVTEQVMLGDSNNLIIGQSIIAVGNPSGEGISVVAGILSVDSEQIEMQSITSTTETNVIRVLRIDAPINGGNSGGGLFDVNGRLLGIVNAKTVDADIEGMCYAIPLSIATGVADSVIDGFNKKVRLGIGTVVEDSKAVYDSVLNKLTIVETIKVTEVDASSISGGIIKVDDYIRSFKINTGEEFLITRSFHLPDLLFKARTGDVLTIKVLRGKEEVSLNITVVAGKLVDL